MKLLQKNGFKCISGSQANFFMVDVKRPGREFQQSMLNENIAIGRMWKALPTYVRVTVGTTDEMKKFKAAFVKCMDRPITSASVAYTKPHDLYVPSELDHGLRGA